MDSFLIQWELLNAHNLLLKEIGRDVRGEIGKNCAIKGAVRIEKGTVVI